MDQIRNLAIIQARMGSSRLPNKVLMDLEGKSVLEHVVNRVSQSKMVDEVIVATTIGEQDIAIVKLCANLGVRVFCGSEDDVLDRYYQVARLLRPDNVIRITADCPLMDPGIIDLVVLAHLNGDYDYTSNTLEETFPDGEDVEVMKYEILEEAWKKAKLSSQREHVTLYIRDSACYRKNNVFSLVNYSNKRWTLDNIEDYEFLSCIYKGLYKSNRYFGMEDILLFLKDYNDFEKFNKHISRNEGLKKSLQEDFLI